MVKVPEGIFMTGAIVLKSNVGLHIEEEGTLLGSTNPDHYFKINRWKALVMADNQNNISITGNGIIDGQGRALALHIDSLFYIGEIDSSQYNFVEMRPKYYLRPQLIEFVECSEIQIRDLTLKNAACWVQTYDKCNNIIIDNIKVDSDAYWNNDGLDIQDCKNVIVSNCTINSADDGICIKSQSSDYYCDNILISDCIVRSSASAIKFGTVSHGGFRNVVIRNIKVYDTFRSAIAIESVDGGFLENILIENIKAKNTGNAFFVRLGERSKKEQMGTLRNVVLRNIKVEVAFERPDYAYEIRGPALPFFHNTFPASITGVPGYPVENITLENITITYPGRGNKGLAYLPLSRLSQIPEKISEYPEFSMFGELPSWGLYVRHVDGLKMKNVNLSLKESDYRPAMVFDDVNNLVITEMETSGETKDHQVILRNSELTTFDDDINVLRIQN